MLTIYRYPYSYWFSLLARLAFALTIILAPLRGRIVLWERPVYPVYGDYTDFLLFSSDLALIYTLTFWACSLLLSPRRISLGSASIWISLAGLTLAGLISTVGGEDNILSRYQFVRLIFLFVFYLYIVNEITAPAWILIPVGLQILLQSVTAIGQSILQHSLGLASLGELSLDPQVRGVSIVPVGDLRFLRAYGLSDHPNILGGCLAFGLVLLFAWMLYGKGRVRWFALTAFLPGILALVMTFSRSAWLGFFIGTSFMVVVEALARKWKSVRDAAVLGVVSVFIVAPFVMSKPSLLASRVNEGNIAEDAPLQERMYLIRAGSTIFVEHLAIGIGLGAAPLAMMNRFPDFRTSFQPPHYALLEAAMETGVLGAACYLFLMVLPALVFVSRWRSLSQQPLVMGSLALLFVIGTVGIFDYYTWLNSTGRIWQWLAWGLWSGVHMRLE